MVKEQPEFIGVVLPVDAGLPVRISFFGLDAPRSPVFVCFTDRVFIIPSILSISPRDVFLASSIRSG